MRIETSVAPEALLGLTEDHLGEVPELNCRVHQQIIQPLQRLRASAGAAGFCLKVASSYRSFERQMTIWNAKAEGLRPVLDSQGAPLDLKELSELQRVHAILRWSALPGSSRHHWGTDFDVYDSSAIATDYRVQLTCDECSGTGPFAAFHQWLSGQIARESSFGFFRPYGEDRGGVAPEPWHLSYAPLATAYAHQRTEQMLRQRLEACEFALKSCVLDHLAEIYQRYIQVS